MNKKYLILFATVIVIFIIFVSVIFFQQNSTESISKPSPIQNQNPALQHADQQAAVPSVTLAPPASTPEGAARQFYQYYFSSPANPLANGAYKNNPYLSQDFKDNIGALYNNGNAPIFCPQNKSASIIVGDEQQVYYNNQYLRQETISEAPPGSKELYHIILENVYGKWLVFDVTCIY